MFEEAQGVRCKLSELQLHPRICLRPYGRVVPCLTLLPYLLRQFLDEGVAVVGLTEAVAARGGFPEFNQSPNGYVSSTAACSARSARSGAGSGVTALVVLNQTKASNWAGRLADE
jgi:hypothetical protein